MFCPNCGNQVPDNMSFCTVCGSRLNANAAAVNQQPYMQVQQEYVQPKSVHQYAYAPVAELQPPKKSGVGVKVIIAVATVVAVAAIVFAVLLGTGTISFDKDNGNGTSASEENKSTIKEPEIGSVSDLPCVEGDRSADKIMMKMKTTGTGDGEYLWIGADYTNPSEPKTYFEMAMYSEIGTITMQAVVFADKSYMKTNFMPGQTLEGDSDFGFLGMFFGDYSNNYFAENEIEFKYLGTEEVTTGNAYVYELNEAEGYMLKVWIDADTGYWVKTESNQEEELQIEVAEIVTGDEIEFPEFDYENAVKGTKDEDFEN